MPGREVIDYVDFKKIYVKKRWIKGTIFLFNDIVLIARFGKAKLKYQYHVLLRNVNVSYQKTKEGNYLFIFSFFIH